MTPWWRVLSCGVVGAAASLSSSLSATTGTGLLTSSLGTMGYPELLLPTTSTAETTVDNPRVQNSTLPAVLNYVSPWIGQLRLLRDPTGHDTFLPPDDQQPIRHPPPISASSSVPPPPSSVSAWDPRTVTIHNGRLQHNSLTLDANGFQLVRSHVPRVPSQRGISVDFYDPADVIATYYPMCESLVRDAWEEEEAVNRTMNRSDNSSSDRVHVFAFDHNVRHGTDDDDAPHDRDEGEGRESGTSQTNVLPPAGIVHNDYTSVSAPRRLEQLASSRALYRNDVMTNVEGNEAQHPNNRRIPAQWVQEALQGKRRYAFVNVWRSIDPIHPVQSFPLALLDAPSVHFLNDVRPLTIHYVDRVGENYVAIFHPEHRWYYFPRMDMDEAILIKQWDSWGDLCHRRRRQRGGESIDDDSPSLRPPHRSTFALHTAFALAPPDSRPRPPRKSIEVRCLCLWDCADAEDDEPLKNTKTLADKD